MLGQKYSSQFIPTNNINNYILLQMTDKNQKLNQNNKMTAPSTNQIRLPWQYPREFSQCLNLSVSGRSIEQVFKIPREMLSKSGDFFPVSKQAEILFSNSQYMEHFKMKQTSIVKSQQKSVNKEQIIPVQENQLNLQQFLSRERPQKSNQKQNLSTKNVLRNFGNAQNYYILYNQQARQIIQNYIENVTQFDSWVRSLKLINFKDYRRVWKLSVRDQQQTLLFKKIYRKLCWRFYQKQSVAYIFSGRLQSNSRYSHLKQISAMMEGLRCPETFNRFSQ